jgi:hypothetical protein
MTKNNAAETPETPEAPAAPAPAPIAFQLVDATVVPPRSVGASAKERLAEYQAKQKAERDAQAAPIVAGLVEGKALTDGVTYKTANEANGVAQRAKRLVEPGLALSDLRPAIRVTGEDEAFTWHLVSTLKAKKAEAPTEAPAEAVTA